MSIPENGLVAPWPVSDPSVLAPVAEHDDLRDAVRGIVGRHGSHDQLRASVTTPEGFSAELWRALNSELGVGTIAVPERLGGVGSGARELGVVLEEAGAALAAEPVLMSSVLGLHALTLADDPAAVAAILAAVMAGEQIATVALRPNPGDIVAVRRSGGWVVRGLARRVVHGAVAQCLIVRADVDGRPTLMAVDLGAGGVTCTDLEVMDTTRRQADLELAEASATLLVGSEGFERVWHRIGSLCATAVAAEHLGMIERLLELTVEHVQQRHQFGRAIGSFQAIKHRLADVLVDLERSRSAVHYAAAVFAGDPDAAELPAAVAASICQDAVVRTAQEAIQLHGGIGFTWEHSAHFFLRRALGDEGLFGSARHHRARLANLVGI